MPISKGDVTSQEGVLLVGAANVLSHMHGCILWWTELGGTRRCKQCGDGARISAIDLGIIGIIDRVGGYYYDQRDV